MSSHAETAAREEDDTAESTQASEAASQHNAGRLTNSGEMDRVSARMPDPMLAALEDAVESGRYANRTVAIRAAVREKFMRGGRR